VSVIVWVSVRDAWCRVCRLSLGVPIVTLPSRQKGRTVAAGALDRLEVRSLIANTTEEYVAMAVQVASSLNLRAQLSSRQIHWLCVCFLEGVNVAVDPQDQSSTSGHRVDD
jgi:hypothetical protein